MDKIIIYIDGVPGSGKSFYMFLDKKYSMCGYR